jgi:hypothetical protein
VKTQLLIKASLLTWKIPQAIQKEGGSITIWGYLLKCNFWMENILTGVHWDTHRVSHLHHWLQRCYLIMLCHWHLPLGANTPLPQHQIPMYVPWIFHQIRITKPFHPMHGTHPNHLAYCTSHKTSNTDEQNEHIQITSRDIYRLSRQINIKQSKTYIRPIPPGSQSTKTNQMAWYAPGLLVTGVEKCVQTIIQHSR